MLGNPVLSRASLASEEGVHQQLSLGSAYQSLTLESLGLRREGNKMAEVTELIKHFGCCLRKANSRGGWARVDGEG